MSEADEYGPGGQYAEGPGNEERTVDTVHELYETDVPAPDDDPDGEPEPQPSDEDAE